MRPSVNTGGGTIPTGDKFWQILGEWWLRGGGKLSWGGASPGSAGEAPPHERFGANPLCPPAGSDKPVRTNRVKKARDLDVSSWHPLFCSLCSRWCSTLVFLAEAFTNPPKCSQSVHYSLSRKFYVMYFVLLCSIKYCKSQEMLHLFVLYLELLGL